MLGLIQPVASSLRPPTSGTRRHHEQTLCDCVNIIPPGSNGKRRQPESGGGERVDGAFGTRDEPGRPRDTLLSLSSKNPAE